MLSLIVECGVRCLLVSLFLPFSALDKILNFQQAIDQASRAVPNRRAAAALIVGGLGIEIVMSVAILTGIADRFAALILAGYCIVTALLWKEFWKAPDFRLKGRSAGREIFWDFWKNIALAGGFLLLALGSDTASVERFVRHPLDSSHPYKISETSYLYSGSREGSIWGNAAARQATL
jgi:putative oxidoreductase